jgi:hypothetical protein
VSEVHARRTGGLSAEQILYIQPAMAGNDNPRPLPDRARAAREDAVRKLAMKRIGFFGALWILIRSGLPDRKSTMAIMAGLAIIAGGDFLLLSACYPWAYSVTFGPTLTGKWVGAFTPPAGGTHIVFLQLSNAQGDGGPDLYGSARLCDGRGAMREFGVTGSTRNWRGTVLRFTTYMPENLDGEGFQLGTVDGEWDTRDTLRATATLMTYKIYGGASHSTARDPADTKPDPVVRFALARGHERDFLAACKKIEQERDGPVRGPRADR